MIVLGIDPGVASCAWSVLDSGVVLCAGVVTTDRDSSRSVTTDARERIFAIMEELDKVAREHTPKRCVVEAFTMQAKGKLSWSAVQTLRLLGRIEEWAEARGMAYSELTTQSVKARLGITNGSKEAVQARVVAITGFELPKTKAKREHVADAIAVGLTA